MNFTLKWKIKRQDTDNHLQSLNFLKVEDFKERTHKKKEDVGSHPDSFVLSLRRFNQVTVGVIDFNKWVVIKVLSILHVLLKDKYFMKV